MSDHSQHVVIENDPLIDEVRTIRRSICDEFGNDVDRLCDHLQEIEKEYRERTGRFLNLPLTISSSRGKRSDQ